MDSGRLSNVSLEIRQIAEQHSPPNAACVKYHTVYLTFLFCSVFLFIPFCFHSRAITLRKKNTDVDTVVYYDSFTKINFIDSYFMVCMKYRGLKNHQMIVTRTS